MGDDFPNTSLRARQVNAKDRRKRKLEKLKKLNKGTGVLDTHVGRLMRPIVGYREQLQMKGVTPKDHHRINRRAIREAAARNRLRKLREKQLAHVPKYMRKFYEKKFDLSTPAMLTKMKKNERMSTRSNRRQQGDYNKNLTHRNTTNTTSTIDHLPLIHKSRDAMPARATGMHQTDDINDLDSPYMKARARAAGIRTPQGEKGFGRDANWLVAVDRSGKEVQYNDDNDEEELYRLNVNTELPSTKLANFADGHQNVEPHRERNGNVRIRKANRKAFKQKMKRNEQMRREMRKVRLSSSQQQNLKNVDLYNSKIVPPSYSLERDYIHRRNDTKAKADLKLQRRRRRQIDMERESNLNRGRDYGRLMSEEERKATLDVLMTAKAKTEAATRAMPLQIHGEGQRRRKFALRAKLEEIENAIEIFKRDQVRVKKRI
eukprot:g5764.t1